MNVTTDDLIQLLGLKEVELMALRRENAVLRQQLAALQTEESADSQ